jgi:hypothetical protein
MLQGQGGKEEEAAEGGQDPGGEGEETVLRGENSEVSSYLQREAKRIYRNVVFALPNFLKDGWFMWNH